MKIKFLKTVVVEDRSGQTFEEGQVYDLPELSAQHWLKRGIAVLIDREETLQSPIKHKDAEPPKKKEGEEEPEPKHRHR